jgi:heme exporter protein C
MDYTESRNRLLKISTYVAIVLVAISAVMIFGYVGPDQLQGHVQKLFYIHLATFFGAFVVFSAAVVAGIQYLRTRDNKWDELGLATIEIGLGFSLINIVTGAIWARPIWNTWWTWDPRLTTITVMWLTYAAYMMLRQGIEDPERRRRFAAVYGILAFSSVLLTVIIIRVRPDTIHPVAAGPSSTNTSLEGDFDMTPRIVQTLLFSISTYIYVAIILTWHRIRLENRTTKVQTRKVNLLMNT